MRTNWAESVLQASTPDPTEGQTRTFIAQLTSEANMDAARSAGSEAEGKEAITAELLRAHDRAMGLATPALTALKAAGQVTSYEALPLSNVLIVRVPETGVEDAYAALTEIPGVGKISADREITLDPSERVASGEAADPDPDAGPATEWNVSKVGAPEAWKQGVEGEGITVGIVDTGVDVEHPAVRSKYRGFNEDGTLNDNYNFFDAIGSKKTPYDDNSHGTHVTGTITGSTKDRNYGMAPKADWIAAKVLSGSGSGSASGILKALEWMMAPRDGQGKNPDPTKAPDVINNSWGIADPNYDGFRSVWKALDASGITVVTAAGNRGPGRGSLDAPGAYPEQITVAATDSRDEAASFSGRGPSPWSPGGEFVPDVAAPGKGVTSSVPGGGYATYSGTSMATPATAGVVALLLSKYPELTSQQVNEVLKSSAVDLGDRGHDSTYGAGRIDVVKALAAAEELVGAPNDPDAPSDPDAPQDPGSGS